MRNSKHFDCSVKITVSLMTFIQADDGNDERRGSQCQFVLLALRKY